MITKTHPISVRYRWQARSLEQVLMAAIVALLCLRLVGLLNLPIFVDEALHLARARNLLAGGVAQDAFNNGKLLSIWLTTPFIALSFDPLLTGRLTAVLANLITAVGIVGLGSTLYSRPVGLASAFIYLLMPYSFFFGRMLLVDNFQAAAFALLLWVTANGVRSRVSIRHIAGLVVIGWILVLSKLTGALGLPAPVVGALLLSVPTSRKLNTIRTLIVMGVVALTVLFFIMQGFGMGEYARRAPTDLFWNIRVNLYRLPRFFAAILTVPGALVSLGIVLQTLKRPTRVKLWLLLSAFMVVLPYLPVATTLYSRYLLPSLVPLSVLAGTVVVALAQQGLRRWHTILAILTVGWMLTAQILMIVDIPSSPLVSEDMYSYVEGAASGYGIQEMASELQALSRVRPIMVLTWSPWDTIGIMLFPYLQMGDRLTFCNLNQRNCSALGEARPVIAINRLHNQSLPDVASQAIEGRELIWSYIRPHEHSSLELWANAK